MGPSIKSTGLYSFRCAEILSGSLFICPAFASRYIVSYSGRGVFNYSVGILPYRRRVVSVVGTPIECIKEEEPSLETVLEYQNRYLEELKSIFHDNREKYAPNATSDLIFVE